MRVAALGGLQLLVSAAAIAAIARGSEDAAAIARLHLGIVGALLLLCAFALGALAQVRRLRAAALFAAIPFALFAGLYAVYVVDLVALRHWGHLVSLPLLGQLLANLPQLVPLVPLRAAVVLGALGAAGWLYGRCAAGLRADLVRLFGRFAPLSLSALALAAALLAALSVGPLLRSPRLWSQEPLVSLLDLQLARPAHLGSAQPPGVADPSAPAPQRRAHVIVFVVDGLRAANMGLYGYERPTTPFLSELAARGELARVDLALAPCSQSDCGVSSLLGSQDAGRLRPGELKLHDVLHALGYRVVFLLSGAHLEWQGLGALFGPHVDLVRDDPSNDDTNLLRALRTLPDADRPTFLYLHLMSTHWFGVQRREHQRYQPTAKRFDWLYDVKRALGGRVAADLRQHVINRYDNSVLQADAMIGRLFGLLGEKGYLDDAVIAIAADHGEALGERGEDYYGHGTELYQELIGIPILFRDTRDRAGFGALGFATLADVAPTLLDRLGARIPDSWDGRSLLSAPPRTRSFHESAVAAARSRSGRDERVRAVVEREPDGTTYKLLRFENGDVREELYELSRDPGEQRDLLDSIAPARRAALEAHLRGHFTDDHGR